MGSGIARLLLATGHPVILCDSSQEALDRALRALGEPPSLTGTLSCRGLEGTVDLVIECVSERAEVKAAVLGDLGHVFSKDVIIASCTSSFTPDELADVTSDPQRFFCLHFFNPPDVVRLVEVQGHEGTDARILVWAAEWIRSLGGLPVVLDLQRRGFVANRLQAALLIEAIALVRDGVVSPAELDLIVTSSIGPRWAAVGPLTVADLGGLDVFAALIERVSGDLAGSADALATLEQMRGEGRLGAKSGRGFSAYLDHGAAAREQVAHAFHLLHGGP